MVDGPGAVPASAGDWSAAEANSGGLGLFLCAHPLRCASLTTASMSLASQIFWNSLKVLTGSNTL
ncbi:MAG: hypothetical protein M3N18_07030, partial [Actinomycetota bacterium]|nr:hypothetical protein [Actinomycetota bacterium]